MLVRGGGSSSRMPLVLGIMLCFKTILMKPTLLQLFCLARRLLLLASSVTLDFMKSPAPSWKNNRGLLFGHDPGSLQATFCIRKLGLWCGLSSIFSEPTDALVGDSFVSATICPLFSVPQRDAGDPSTC